MHKITHNKKREKLNINAMKKCGSFNLPGHDKNNFKFTILEKVRSDPLYGRERENITKENSTHFILESKGSHDMWLYNYLTIVDILY